MFRSHSKQKSRSHRHTRTKTKKILKKHNLVTHHPVLPHVIASTASFSNATISLDITPFHTTEPATIPAPVTTRLSLAPALPSPLSRLQSTQIRHIFVSKIPKPRKLSTSTLLEHPNASKFSTILSVPASSSSFPRTGSLSMNQIRQLSTTIFQPSPTLRSSTSTPQTPAPEEAPKGFKGFFKKYGKTFVYSYFGVYFAFLGALTVAFDVIPMLDAKGAVDYVVSTGHVDRPLQIFNAFLDAIPLIGEPIRANQEFFSNFAAAWCTTKFTEPIRLPLAMGLTKFFADKKAKETQAHELENQQQQI